MVQEHVAGAGVGGAQPHQAEAVLLHFNDLPLLKTPKKLPVVLSPEEVTRFIAAPNLLYRTLLLLLYAKRRPKSLKSWIVGHSYKALVPLLLRAVRGCYGRVGRDSGGIAT